MRQGLLTIGFLIGVAGAAHAQGLMQTDTSMYRQAPQPSFLDQVGQAQRLELQRQQIEMGRLQLEQQRLQLEQQRLQAQQADPEYRRQVEFERKQAEAYQKRRAGPAKPPVSLSPPRN
jgi:hypothetical protein